MEKVWLASVIMLVAGVFPGIVFGYLIAVKQQWSMISGWDESKLSNPAAFARLIGFSLLVLGAAIALIAIGWGLQLLSDRRWLSAYYLFHHCRWLLSLSHISGLAKLKFEFSKDCYLQWVL